MPEGLAFARGGCGRLHLGNTDHLVESVVADPRTGSPGPVACVPRRPEDTDWVPGLVGLLKAAASLVALRSDVQHPVSVVDVGHSSGGSDDNRERAVLNSYDPVLECAVGAMEECNGPIRKPLPDLSEEIPFQFLAQSA